MNFLFKKDFWVTPFEPDGSVGWADILAMSVSGGRPERRARMSDWMNYVGAVLALVILGAAVVALFHISQQIEAGAVSSALASVSVSDIVVGLLLTGASYSVLSGYDFLALRYLAKRVPLRRVMLASFLSYSFGNSIGFQFVTGGSMRYRIYRRSGLTAADAAKVTAVASLTFVFSVLLVLGLALYAIPGRISAVNQLPVEINGLFGIIIFSLITGYVGWVGNGSRSISWGDWRVPLPGTKFTLAQFAVGLADMAFASAALYMLLPSDATVSYPLFAAVFVAALCAGLLSNIPGGLGVFESVMLLALPGVETGSLLASLLLFRCVYYLVPLGLGIALLVLHEARHAAYASPFRFAFAHLLRRAMSLLAIPGVRGN